MSTHAILSPSGAERWLNCTPSARLEQQFPDRAGEAAKEGTLAHAIGELLIRVKLKTIKKYEYEEVLAGHKKNTLYNDDMLAHAEEYASFVLERFLEAQTKNKHALIFLEQKLNLTDYVPEGFGTGDVIIIADGVLDIIDLKYGKGVPVSAENNKQMMLYSLGALREFEYMYDIDTVRMTIYQPRLDSISTWEIPAEQLNKWADEELKPRAALAFEGEGEFKPGKHCQFCRAKGICKANAAANLEIAKYDFRETTLLKDEEVADIIDRAATFINWINGVEEYALNEAVAGKKWPGYKVVEGRSNRKYLDDEKVATKLLQSGFNEAVIFKPQALLSITAMEKVITKKVFEDTLKGLIIKPPGKPALVPLSDKRPELNSAESAKKDFETA